MKLNRAAVKPRNLLKRFDSILDMESPNGPRDQTPVKTRRTRLFARRTALSSEFEKSPISRMKSTESAGDSDDDFLDLMDLDREVAHAVPEGFEKLLDAPLINTPSRKKSSRKLFERADVNNGPLKTLRGKRQNCDLSPVQKKRCRFDESQFCESDSQLCQSEAQIKSALNRDDNELTGDFSRSHCLPTVTGKHSDLRSITPETLSRLMDEQYEHVVDQVVIVDSRYPYEYEGGHIPGAKNLWTQDRVQELLETPRLTTKPGKRMVIVFHCEFSSERGPKMARFLRSQDRLKNSENYPALCYPELYLLDGGYKNFYEQCPQYGLTYKPMLHEGHGADLRHFRAKTKTSTSRKHSRRDLAQTRTGLKF